MTLTVILLIAALVCFLVAAVVGYAYTADTRRGIGRADFIALGLALWVITLIIAALPH